MDGAGEESDEASGGGGGKGAMLVATPTKPGNEFLELRSATVLRGLRVRSP